MIPFLIAAVFFFHASPQLAERQFADPQTLKPIAVSSREAKQHQLSSGPLYVRLKAPPKPGSNELLGLSFDVIVDPAGAVISAIAIPEKPEPPPELVTQAESLVRALKFKPFERDGHAITAGFQTYVGVLPPELKPAQHVSFPKVRDWKSVRITLHRTMGAFGHAPAYTVEILGDGQVFYNGEYLVAFAGKHRAVVPREQVVELVKLFARANFYSLADKYALGNSEGPQVTTSIQINGRRKQLLDISGVAVGMPLAAGRLEEAIDRIAGSERWVHGNAETLAALQAEPWDLISHSAAVALARLADFGDPDVALELIHAGTPLDGSASRTHVDLEGSCCTALGYAAKHRDLKLMQALLDAGAAANPEIMDRALFDSASGGNVDAFHLLLANGASVKTHDPGGWTLLMAAASSGSPAMLKEILKSDKDVNAIAHPSVPPCESEDRWEKLAKECSPPESSGHTALMEAIYLSDYENSQEQVDRAEVVRLLLAAGADVNARDAEGDTALLFCHMNLELASLLLRAGADPNVRNHGGDTPLHLAGSDEMQRLLIEHGAVATTEAAKE